MAKAIMIQGTASNTGKSIITAGLCRIFTQDGYKTAPFKSQNMALNSYITKDGLEIGRAQAMQAECCNKKPDSRMNPILLKPTSETGSQVIINGTVYKNMSASEYFKFKEELKPQIMKAYNSLSDENDIIVIEGAGSPAEINLKSNDIVNMGLAEMVKAPVILVGDIDRGGVFASLYGTVMLLNENERKYIKALIINKFRGDKNILLPGLNMLEKKINIPFKGVIPYSDINIDDEDSLSSKLSKKDITGKIDIAVIKFPHISNFTDFNSLENIKEVSIRYVEKQSELKKPNLIILPGSKNTISDLKWLRKTGLENEIIKASENQVLILGICGGYQMLGNMINDPFNTESGGSIKGMCLINTETTFKEEKTKTVIEGKFNKINGYYSLLSDLEFEGYEIHMGETIFSNTSNKLYKLTDAREEGHTKNNILGTYIHGMFDKKETAKALIKCICKKDNINIGRIEAVDMQKYKDEQYNILADIIRNNVDIDYIYKILEKGI